ncbi:MAG: ATP-binding cassette domain-containing protein [Spirochaetia bacterium]|jgi:ABC-2 type transport system ATP-binding protein|nr:ATP-binding cassette domain-containing protein [Spirochaetia bacterium]
MIQAEGIEKKYGSFKAVDDVSISIGRGEIVGLLGPNGAGKTTIMKILTGYHLPTKGTAVINSYDVYKEPLKVKESIGYLPETAPLYTDLTVNEYLSFICDVRKIGKDKRKEAIDRVISECGLEQVINRPIDNISKGYRQRTGLAQAIIHSPEILVLDEPTSGLDPNQIIEIRKLIQKIGKDKTIILSTHILQEVEAVCNRVLILNQGKIAARGTTEEIRREMKGDFRYSIELKAEDSEKARASLSGLDTVNEILKFNTSSKGFFEIRLSVKDELSSGEAIFDWAVKNNCKILSMIPEKVSLEDLFIKLTNQGEGK